MRFSWAQACARRLDQHALSAPLADAGPASAVAAMCGAHAQVMAAAEWSIGLRLAAGTHRDVRAALWAQRSLVKTFGPRGTVHLLPAADLPMWTGALAAIPPPPAHSKNAFLTSGQTDAVLAAIAGALADAELTIDELSREVVARAGSWAGEKVLPAFAGRWPRWRQAMSLAGSRGVVCFGPRRGRQVTFTSPRRWLPGFRPAAGPAAVDWLVRRYLSAYGPATPARFAQWLGAPRPWAAEKFASLAAGLRQVKLGGAPAWLAADDAAVPPVPPRGVRLLPYFDPYVVGSQPRELLFAGRAAGRALSRSGQAGCFPVLLIDGTVRGVWHQRRSGRNLDITVEPLGRLTASQRRELDTQAARLGEFGEGTARLTIGTVSAGPHL